MRSLTGALLAAMLVAALDADLASPAAAQEAADGRVSRDLDELRFGVQLVGPRLSRHDLEGRVVVLYHWCITCPISTGAFPYMNRLAEQYADRGVLVIGFQVARNPVLEENNVVWALHHLRPSFPVAMLGTEWEWPAMYLPWVIVFDHEGRRIYGGNLPGLEEVLDGALAAAPHHLVGGPYARLAAVAAEIAGDPRRAGSRLPELREKAAQSAGDAAETAEARALVACLERWFRGQVAKAQEAECGPVERAEILGRLAELFAGDVLGAEARRGRDEAASAPCFSSEEEAWRALERAHAVFRGLPPAGEYTYDMDYYLIDDAALLATRCRMIADFRFELQGIQQEHAGTAAADGAESLLCDHEMPEIESAAARARLEQARALLHGARQPYELFDACLLAFEVVEGHAAKDEIAEEAADLLRRVREEDGFAQAERVHRQLDDRESRVREQVRQGGSALAREEADRMLAEMRAIASEAGAASRLAGRAVEFVAEVEQSFAGPAHLGVMFDESHQGKGARIVWVVPATAAERHGLRPGDVILEFNGQGVDGVPGLREAIAALRPGAAVDVVIERAAGQGAGGAARQTLRVVLGRRV